MAAAVMIRFPKRAIDDAESQRRRELYRQLVPLKHGELAPVLVLPKRFARLSLEDFGETGRLGWMRPYLPMASRSCLVCSGIGVQFGYEANLCKCVWRRICRVMTDRYRENQSEGYVARSCVATLTASGKDCRFTWGRKNEEFSADLWLLAKRVLDAQHFAVFSRHSLGGMAWPQASRQVGLGRGAFFHHVYRAEVDVAQAAVALVPYALFPLDDYFQVGCVPMPVCKMPFRSSRKAA